MSERLPQGKAFKKTDREIEAKRSRFANVQANNKARKDFILDGELTAEELVAQSARLKAEMYARRGTH